MARSDRSAGQARSTPNVGVLMFVAHRSLEERALVAARASGATDVTMAQARLLQRVDPQGTRLGELADRARISKQSAGFLVDQLERAGYLERVADPTDGRARLVRFTDRARALADVADAEVARALAEWEAHLGTRAMDQLVASLTRLREITDPFA